MPSDSEFAWNVVRLTEACLAICKHTKGCGVQIVSAGNLLLPLKYDEVEGHFMIHERHTIKDDCIDDLGLSDGASEGSVLFHTVKLLFEEALRQRLAAKSKVLTAREKKREQALVEQELLTYCHLKDSLVLSSVEDSSCAIQVRWASSITRNYIYQVALELHPVSTCSRIRNQRLRKCKPLAGPTPLWRDITDIVHPVLPAECSCSRVSPDLALSSHIFKDLVPNQAYFAVLYDADAPDSFLVASKPFTPSAPAASRPSPSRPSACRRSAATESTTAEPEPQYSDYCELTNEILMFTRDESLLTRSLYTALGPEIPDITMTRMDDRTWYKAVGGEEDGWQDTVIGKKRRRIEN